MTRSISIAVVFTACASAQSFEVASIRPHAEEFVAVAGRGGVGLRFSGSRLTAQNNSLSNLIGFAYDLKPFQVVATPSWADADRYDVEAKAGDVAELTREMARPMMQALLAERFQLKAHHEMRDIPVYALVVAKNGPKFKESAPDAQSWLTMGGVRTNVLKVTKGSMAQLAGQLSNNMGVDRPVLDRTGLTGAYDYAMESVSEYGARADGEVASIFTAIQDQLGLKLEKATAAMDVLVIDHAEKPSEN